MKRSVPATLMETFKMNVIGVVVLLVLSGPLRFIVSSFMICSEDQFTYEYLGEEVTTEIIGSASSPTGSELKFDLNAGGELGGRSYLGTFCDPAKRYDNKYYSSMVLADTIMSWDVNLKGVGCGCNVAFYLTSMQENSKIGNCGDHYCDANSVCGVACAEIDLMESNMYSFHSTVHGADDPYGYAGGFGGGGDEWNGPRDFTLEQYHPGNTSTCIDTSQTFSVEIGFPLDKNGELKHVAVKLSQDVPDRDKCSLSFEAGNFYPNMKEMAQVLTAGMTPIVSYWDGEMSWMDGLGQDGLGGCEPYTKPDCSETEAVISNIVVRSNGPSEWDGVYVDDDDDAYGGDFVELDDVDDGDEKPPEKCPRVPPEEGGVSAGGVWAIIIVMLILALAFGVLVAYSLYTKYGFSRRGGNFHDWLIGLLVAFFDPGSLKKRGLFKDSVIRIMTAIDRPERGIVLSRNATTKDILLAVVERDPHAMSYLALELSNDREFVAASETIKRQDKAVADAAAAAEKKKGKQAGEDGPQDLSRSGHRKDTRAPPTTAKKGDSKDSPTPGRRGSMKMDSKDTPTTGRKGPMKTGRSRSSTAPVILSEGIKADKLRDSNSKKDKKKKRGKDKDGKGESVELSGPATANMV